MNEITLFDTNGSPIAYILHDEDNTIYLWEGEPVAYLDGDDIFGFNGKHLGWFEKGIMWDHDGFKVGFIKETLKAYAQYEPYKAYKQYKPYKAYKEYKPYKPYKSVSVSTTPLSAFLLNGQG